MAAVPPRPERRRPRPGSLERPVNGRLYRGTWLIVGLPLLLLAFTVERPQPLPAPVTPPTFDGGTAASLASDLSLSYPPRFPGSVGGVQAAAWYRGRVGQSRSLVPGSARAGRPRHPVGALRRRRPGHRAVALPEPRHARARA